MSSPILFLNNNIPFSLKQKNRIRQWIEAAIQHEGKTVGEITYMFGDDAYVLQINQSFLQHDYLTDIITFDYCEGDVISGDIVISVDRVRENARLYHMRVEEEMHRVIIHGILHLCGYKDKRKKEAQQMREKEDYYLRIFPINNL